MRDLVMSTGRKDNLAEIKKTVEVPWPRLVRSLSRRPKETDDKSEAGWYIPARFEPEYRSSDNLAERYALTFDYDDITPDDLEDIKRTYSDYEYLMYTTASHKSGVPRVRMILPLTRAAEKDEFECVTRTVGAEYDLEKLARESDTPAQMSFFPTVKPDGKFWAVHNEGEWIDVDEQLENYDDWRDRTEWPVRAEADSVRSVDDIVQPDEKPGIVGDFCRAFLVPDAISLFNLPYTQSANNSTRYTYDAGSRPDGLRIYDDGLKAHSDHNTDPAHGQHNAFDLVRLHKFGDLDKDKHRQLPITERPSFKAMADFAQRQKEVMDARTANEFGALEDDYEPPVEEQTTKRFEVIPAHEFASQGEFKWIVKGVIPRAEIVVAYGPSGSGKSFFVLDLCASAARGIPWRERTVHKSKVVYVCAEGAGGFRQRIKAYEDVNMLELNDFWVVGDAPDILEAKDAVGITRSILDTAGRVDLVVIDTLAASMPGGDENTGKDMGQYVKHCKLISKTLRCTVILVHHSGKDTSKGARGWSGLRAAADAELEVSRDGDYRTVTVAKMKDGSDGSEWTFKLQGVNIGIDEDGDPISSCVVEHVDVQPRQKYERRKPQGKYNIGVFEVAQYYLRKGNAMSIDELRKLAKEKFAAPEGRDTRGQRVTESINWLLVEGYLHKQDDEISLTSAIMDDETWEQMNAAHEEV